MCRSRQTEAKINLKALDKAEAAYKSAHAKYAGSVASLAFKPGSSRYYDLAVASKPGGYVGTATGKGKMAGDVWTIDQTGVLKSRTNKCP